MVDPLSEAQIVDIADALAARGWVVLEQATPAAQIGAFRARISALQNQDAMRPAGIGRDKSAKTAPQVRSDTTFWLDSASADACDQALLAWLEHLRSGLNAQLFLGADSVEAHYARYPSGGHYAKHLDRHRDSDARVLSLVLYLNESWQRAWGGQLKLYDAADQPLATIEPHGGTLVLFRSEQFPHEVVPAAQPRMSVAAWFRRRT
jgi:SM-20-related protein